MTESAHIHPSRLVNFTTALISGAGEITGKVQSPEDAVDAGQCQSEKPCTAAPTPRIPFKRVKKSRALQKLLRPRKTKKPRLQTEKLRRKRGQRELDELPSLFALQIKMDNGLPCGICNQLPGFRTCPQVVSSTANPRFIVQHPTDAAFFAAGITNPNWMQDKPRIVFYTDGAATKHDTRPSLTAGAAITDKKISQGNASDWADSSCGIVGTTRSDPSELYAVGLALETAANELEATHKSSREAEEQGDQASLRLLFITDSQAAMQDVHNYIYRGKIPKKRSRDDFLPLMRPIIRLMDFNVTFEFHWVPGHKGIEGNVRADALAGLASKLTLSRLPSIADNVQSEFQVLQIPEPDEQAGINIVGSQPSGNASELFKVLVPQAAKCNSAPKKKQRKAVGFEKGSAYANMAVNIHELQAQWVRSDDSLSSESDVSTKLQDKQVSKPEILNSEILNPEILDSQPRKRKASLGEALDPRPPKRISKVDEVPDQQDPKCDPTPEKNSKSGFFHEFRATMAKQIGKLQALWKRSSDAPSHEL
ncbi:hypothetical protein LQW54_003982 [Pestalotiopsis sp. IQ-011]